MGGEWISSVQSAEGKKGGARLVFNQVASDTDYLSPNIIRYYTGDSVMKALIIVVTMFASSLSAAWAEGTPPQSKEPDHVTQLRWLDSADADKMLQADIKSGKYQFYVVCAFSCEPASLDKLDAVQCYPVAKLTRIAGTSDAYQSNEDIRYQNKAWKFAERYNVQMAEYLSKHEMTDCVVGESWESAIHEMKKRVGERYVSGDEVDAAYSKNTHKLRFTAHLSPGNRNEEFEIQLCLIAMESHLSGSVIVEIYDPKNAAPPSSIECRYGQVLPSDWKPVPSDHPYDNLISNNNE